MIDSGTLALLLLLRLFLFAGDAPQDDDTTIAVLARD